MDADLPDLWQCVAEVAVPNLTTVTPSRDRTVQGVGDADHARLVACAEGAERFAAGDPAAAELVRARHAELPGAVDPRALYARDLQHEDADVPRLWAPVVAGDGERRWVPAETVFLSLPDPAPGGASIPWTSATPS